MTTPNSLPTHSNLPPKSDGVGKYGSHFMGPRSHTLWLPPPMERTETSTPKQTSRLPASTAQRRGRSPRERGRRHARKRSNRSSQRPDIPRLLLQTVHTPQSVGGVPPNTRPIPPQPTPATCKIQNGIDRHHPPIHPTPRLGSLSGSQRRILPHKDLPQRSKMATVCLERTSIPIQSPPLRPQPGPMGLHEAGKRPGCCLPQPRHETTHRPGRLAPPVRIGGGMQPTLTIPPLPVNQTGVHHPPRKIGTPTITNLHILGDEFQHHNRDGSSKSSQNTGPPEHLDINTDTGNDISEDNILSDREDGITGSPPSPRQNTQKTTPESLDQAVQTGHRLLEQTNPDTTVVHRDDNTVAKTKMAVSNCPSSPTATHNDNLHRCVETRMGSPHGLAHSQRELGPRAEKSSHKQTGIGSSRTGPADIPGTHSPGTSPDHVRQHLSGSFNQQPGRNPCSKIINQDRTDPSLGSGKGLDTISQTCGGQRQYNGRPPKQAGLGPTNGVDPDSRHPTANLGNLGKAPCGPIRNKILKKTTAVRLSSARPGSMEDRRNVLSLEQPCSLRLSPAHHDTICSGESPLRQPTTHSDSAILARETMVPLPTETEPLPTMQVGNDRQEPRTTSIKNTTRKRLDTKPARMATLRRSMRRRGLSKDAVKLANAAHRASTIKVYNHHWNDWEKWCLDQEIDSHSPETQDIANYLAHLESDRALAAATIRARRAAISTTLTMLGSDNVTCHPIINSVLQGIALKQARQPRRTPYWDLNVILSALRKPPYEPLRDSALDKLTVKTAFLVTLASGRRASEVAHLSGSPNDISFNRDGSITLRFLPTFLAKNQRTNDFSPEITIKSLSRPLQQGHEDIANCPVRALKVYRDRTKRHRSPTQKALFISMNKALATDIVSTTLSRWLKTVICQAYKGLNKDPNGGGAFTSATRQGKGT